jgi:hypothetical protein
MSGRLNDKEICARARRVWRTDPGALARLPESVDGESSAYSREAFAVIHSHGAGGERLKRGERGRPEGSGATLEAAA